MQRISIRSRTTLDRTPCLTVIFRLPARYLIAISCCLASISSSSSAVGQGFAWDHPGGHWERGIGVVPPRLGVVIGVPPSFPWPIGVPPGFPWPYAVPPAGFGFPPPPAWHPPAFAAYPDYRALYNQRVFQAHHDQLRHDDSWPPLNQAGLDSISDQLIQAARRLDQALIRRGDQGEPWRQYLSTEVLIASDQQPLTDAEWAKVRNNYDGVVANSDLRWLMRSDGFADTRYWIAARVAAIEVEELPPPIKHTEDAMRDPGP